MLQHLLICWKNAYFTLKLRMCKLSGDSTNHDTPNAFLKCVHLGLLVES